MSEHMGISPLTGAPSTAKTNVSEHRQNTGHPTQEQDFRIMHKSTEFNVKTAESIFIHIGKPSLNGKTSSVPLFVLG